jgi:microcompartment protein CcmL/EutN
MVEILRESGAASTPANVLGAIDDVNQAMNGGLPADQWKTIVEWCIIVGQSDAND